MDEVQIYHKVLDKLFDGLRTDNHAKFKNDRFGERIFAVNDIYPDVILTRKGTTEIVFIIEIVLKGQVKKELLFEKWKPLSESGSIFYLLVPKENRTTIEQWCHEEKMKFRIGTYELTSNAPEIKFY